MDAGLLDSLGRRGRPVQTSAERCQKHYCFGIESSNASKRQKCARSTLALKAVMPSRQKCIQSKTASHEGKTAFSESNIASSEGNIAFGEGNIAFRGTVSMTTKAKMRPRGQYCFREAILLPDIGYKREQPQRPTHSSPGLPQEHTSRDLVNI